MKEIETFMRNEMENMTQKEMERHMNSLQRRKSVNEDAVRLEPMAEENVIYEDPSQFDFDLDNETFDNIAAMYKGDDQMEEFDFEPPLSEMKLPLACKRNFNLCFNLGINLSSLSNIDFKSVVDITKQRGSWKNLKVTYSQRDADLKIKTVVHTYENDNQKKFTVLEYMIGRYLPFLEVTPN